MSFFDIDCFSDCLVRKGFRKENIRLYQINNGNSITIAFSHSPYDTRTACISAIPSTSMPDWQDIRKTGTPLTCIGSSDPRRWDVWCHTEKGPRQVWKKEQGTIDSFFSRHKSELSPQAIFRAKMFGRLHPQQLNFVDVGMFEMVEAEAGQQLCRLIERMILETRTSLRWQSNDCLSEQDIQWLVKANFWLLAARILQDKRVPRFIRLDLENIDMTFERVAQHYGASVQRISSQHHMNVALANAVSYLQQHSSLELVSTETLAYVYENALITKETRRTLGTHSTPLWLVNYIFSRMAPWIEEMPEDRRHVYEPTCGHAPFLVGALRFLSATPYCTALNDNERHVWLKAHLSGSEIDDFAREIARLSLTLADIPNPNGWQLDSGNIFEGSRLANHIHNANIIVANPPFESDSDIAAQAQTGNLLHVSKAAEVLRQIVCNAQPGALIGFIMPQTLLDSSKAKSLRMSLCNNFEWQEVLRLPDKDVFKVADVESAILIGRRLTHNRKRAQVCGTTFKNVFEDDVTIFQKTGQATITQISSIPIDDNDSNYTLLLPDLADIWDYLKGDELGAIADVGQGFAFENKKNVVFENNPQTREKKHPGYERGFFRFPDATCYTHQLPLTTYLNRNAQGIRYSCLGYASGYPQLVLNYARINRGAWRLAAYIDDKGHPATSRFLVVRPKGSHYSLSFLWAVLNSPVANAYSKSFTSKSDNLAGVMRKMPLPVPTDKQIREIESAANDYRDMASKFSASKQKRHSRTHKNDSMPHLELFQDETGMTPYLEESSDTRLRDMHWRMDAAVLRLYNLPPTLERRLLDYFSGCERGRVPFRQTEYIPRKFSAINTLQELLDITADWPEVNERRSVLIEKEYEGRITAKELSELERLQKQTSLRRQLIAPYPVDDIRREIERLKRERFQDE
jgi:Type I restriction-modification system methyltransferase subunit